MRGHKILRRFAGLIAWDSRAVRILRPVVESALSASLAPSTAATERRDP
jgi:hypothetical protein